METEQVGIAIFSAYLKPLASGMERAGKLTVSSY